MTLHLAKGSETLPYVLTCTRDDGSVTWQRSLAYFLYHDLIHYAVETTLGYREAFLGLLAAGKEFQDFGTRDGVRDHYTAEECWAEEIVGLLQWPSVGGGPGISDDELLAQLAQLAFGPDALTPRVTLEQLRRIRERVAELHARWDAVPPGGL